MNLPKLSVKAGRSVPTLSLVTVVLLASWMGYAYGGYFVKDWAPVVFILAALVLAASLAGTLRAVGSWWGAVAFGLFAAYMAWTALSLLWSPNRGDAWLGAGQTLLYFLTFGVAVVLLGLGASRRWVLVASVLGPAIIAAATLMNLAFDPGGFFVRNRLAGTVGYFNGEAAFLLVPFWAAVYLAGSRRMNPAVRGLVLVGATLCVEVAVLTQSRGAAVAMSVSLPVFFVLSGQRLRGLLALAPVAAALLVSFPGLNAVYLAFLDGGDAAAALNRVIPVVWWTSIAAGLYGFLWATVDGRWSPPGRLVRAFGATVAVVLAVATVAGAVLFYERIGDPVAWTAERWETFKNVETTETIGQEQSRYFSVSGAERYTLWEVAWRDFVENPLLGVGTQNYEATYYRLRERPVGHVRQPHILPLEVLSERGLIGGALFFGFLGVCLAGGLRQRFGHLNAEGKALVGATVAAVAYWFVHSTADWFWQLPAVTLPAVVYLAVLIAPWHRTPSRHRSETGSSGWPLRVGVALGSVLAIAAVVPLYAADRYLAQSYATTNPWVALESVERAQGLNPADPQLSQREAELATQIGDWPRAEEAYGEAIRSNPEHYAPHVLLANFYEQIGEPGEALGAYRQAAALNPLDEEIEQQVTRLAGES